MATLGKTIFVIVLLVCLSGCTLHFKGTDVELDAEAPQVKSDTTYELMEVAFFDGGASK